MKTIPRNHTKKIEVIKASIVSVVYYDQNGGGLKPTTLGAAMSDLHRFDFSKLHDNGDGKYTVHVHSNLWYHLYTQAYLDATQAEQVKRDAARAQRPAIATPTREQRNAATIARTTSIHDLGKPAETLCEHGNNHKVETCRGCGTEDEDGNQVDAPAVTAQEVARVLGAPKVTVTQTRKAMGSQIQEACNALGIKLDHGWNKDTSSYVVNGRHYTAGELADLVLEGGFNASFGRNETRVNWDSPLITPLEEGEAAAKLLDLFWEMDSEASMIKWDADPEKLTHVLRENLNTLRGIAARMTVVPQSPKVDFPPGAKEPGPEVTAVRSVQSGRVLRREGALWVDRWGGGCTWYQMNLIDPMSEGFNIHKEG